MATIKLNSDGRVLLTSGNDGSSRVRCECCDSVALCCVYPATCGLGPPSITFYGETLAGSGTAFGDTLNGVILEGDVWAVYRNGQRTTQDCLGLALPEQDEANVAADLPTNLVLSIEFVSAIPNISPPPATVESFFSFAGEMIFTGGFLDLDNPLLGQCYYSLVDIVPGQFYDEGFVLARNSETCRWELWDSPLGFLYAYRDDADIVGSYTIAEEYSFGQIGIFLTSVVIS